MLSALPALSLVVFAVAASAEVTLVDPVAATWFAGWHGDEFPLSQLSWNKYTHVTYAFAYVYPLLLCECEIDERWFTERQRRMFTR